MAWPKLPLPTTLSLRYRFMLPLQSAVGSPSTIPGQRPKEAKTITVRSSLSNRSSSCSCLVGHRSPPKRKIGMIHLPPLPSFSRSRAKKRGLAEGSPPPPFSRSILASEPCSQVRDQVGVGCVGTAGTQQQLLNHGITFREACEASGAAAGEFNRPRGAVCHAVMFTSTFGVP